MKAIGAVFRLIFNRLVLLVIGLVALALLVWWIGPTISISNFRPFESETVRWIQIAVLFLAPGVRAGWRYLKAKRANAALADGLLQAPAGARPDVGAEEAAQLRKRFEEALGLLKQAALRRRAALAVDADPLARLAAVPLQSALVRVHRRAGGRQDHRADQLRTALPPRGSARSRGRARRRRHAQLRLVVHRRGRVPGHRRAVHHPAERPGRRRVGLEELPAASQEIAPAPAHQRRAGHGQRRRSPAAVDGGARRAHRGAPLARPGALPRSWACGFPSTCW